MWSLRRLSRLAAAGIVLWGLEPQPPQPSNLHAEPAAFTAAAAATRDDVSAAIEQGHALELNDLQFHRGSPPSGARMRARATTVRPARGPPILSALVGRRFGAEPSHRPSQREHNDPIGPGFPKSERACSSREAG